MAVRKNKKDEFIADSDAELEQASGSDEAAFTDGGSGSDDARKPKVNSKKASKAKAKPASTDHTKPVAKKRKVKDEDDEEADTKPQERAASSSSSRLQKNEDGDFYADLDKFKRVTVRQFKDKTLIDIREYYTDKNTEQKKPGKKGIALSVEAWESLKGIMAAVDDEAKRLASK